MTDEFGLMERVHNLEKALREEREARAEDRKGFERNVGDIRRKVAAVAQRAETAIIVVDALRVDLHGTSKTFPSATVQVRDLVMRIDHASAVSHAVWDELHEKFPKEVMAPVSK